MSIFINIDILNQEQFQRTDVVFAYHKEIAYHIQYVYGVNGV
jgi:hypothetical protein